jgi:hypothetical protein
VAATIRHAASAAGIAAATGAGQSAGKCGCHGNFAALQQFTGTLSTPPALNPAPEETGVHPLKSNHAFACAIAISLLLGAVVMFGSLHAAASNMQVTM